MRTVALLASSAMAMSGNWAIAKWDLLAKDGKTPDADCAKACSNAKVGMDVVGPVDLNNEVIKCIENETFKKRDCTLVMEAQMNSSYDTSGAPYCALPAPNGIVLGESSADDCGYKILRFEDANAVATIKTDNASCDKKFFKAKAGTIQTDWCMADTWKSVTADTPGTIKVDGKTADARKKVTVSGPFDPAYIYYVANDGDCVVEGWSADGNSIQLNVVVGRTYTQKSVPKCTGTDGAAGSVALGAVVLLGVAAATF